MEWNPGRLGKPSRGNSPSAQFSGPLHSESEYSIGYYLDTVYIELAKSRDQPAILWQRKRANQITSPLCLHWPGQRGTTSRKVLSRNISPSQQIVTSYGAADLCRSTQFIHNTDDAPLNLRPEFCVRNVARHRILERTPAARGKAHIGVGGGGGGRREGGETIVRADTESKKDANR